MEMSKQKHGHMKKAVICSPQAPRRKISHRVYNTNTRPYLNRAEIKGLFSPFGLGSLFGLGGSAAGGAAGSAAGAGAGAGVGGFFTRFGGLDGILSTMGKFQKMFGIMQQMGPIFKIFGGLGGIGGLGGLAGVKAQNATLPAKVRKRRAKSTVRKRKTR